MGASQQSLPGHTASFSHPTSIYLQSTSAFSLCLHHARSPNALFHSAWGAAVAKCSDVSCTLKRMGTLSLSSQDTPDGVNTSLRYASEASAFVVARGERTTVRILRISPIGCQSDDLRADQGGLALRKNIKNACTYTGDSLRLNQFRSLTTNSSTGVSKLSVSEEGTTIDNDGNVVYPFSVETIPDSLAITGEIFWIFVSQRNEG
ncbi:hypothetical protein WOLCODRAFT_159826 [Wolfiporia cocos MD-104 SS10]|uniref:Uncharacterized protein n=1 Tax=Wolfiporia cocos (strain MD-104) TaxID=742152 RepID=A0A2H3IZW2_WOLCO|nr:hypothetical protein WOLCODRAFT_159826 [Wolfiporia cocos MD-104 SS10]